MKKKILVFILLLAAVSGAFYFVSQKIKVATVNCQNSEEQCSPSTQALVNSFVGQSYFNAKRDLSTKLAQSSAIETYRISFQLPSTMRVALREKKPEVAVKFADNRYFLFDREGNLVREAESSELPTILVRETPDNRAVHFSSVLFQELLKYYSAKNASLDKFGLAAEVNGGVEVTFPLEGDIDVILGSLEVVLLQLNEAYKNPTIMEKLTSKTYAVDLRYKNPVVH